MLDQLAHLFQGVSVLVVGDVMLDEYILGTVSRISPEAPVPVVDVKSRKLVLGGAANVAANIAGLGSGVAVTALVAFDHAGEQVRELFRKAGIGTEGLVDAGSRGTTSKTRIVAGQQQVVRIDHENRGPVSAGLLESVLAAAKRQLDGKQVLILSDYAKGLLSDSFCAAIIAAARERNIPVIVDPKSREFSKYRGCTVITPNLSEASLAAGVVIDSEKALFEAGEYLLKALPGTNVLITRGPEGMTLFHEGAEPLTVPTVARQIFDVVGAGDTVIATLAVCCGAGIPICTAMRIANIAAGIVVEKPGTATTTVEEILAHHALGGLPHLTLEN